jgi:hypothetical protein
MDAVPFIRAQAAKSQIPQDQRSNCCTRSQAGPHSPHTRSIKMNDAVRSEQLVQLRVPRGQRRPSYSGSCASSFTRDHLGWLQGLRQTQFRGTPSLRMARPLAAACPRLSGRPDHRLTNSPQGAGKVMEAQPHAAGHAGRPHGAERSKKRETLPIAGNCLMGTVG